jgi:transposase
MSGATRTPLGNGTPQHDVLIRRGSGSVVSWRRAQMVLLAAQGMDVPAIAKLAFTSEDRVRDVIRTFDADGFGSLYRNTKAAGRRSSRLAHPLRTGVLPMGCEA